MEINMREETEHRISGSELEHGTKLFLNRLEEIVDSEPEVRDVHEAFEMYCLKRYSLGNSATNQRVGGKGDLGIDFYSQKDGVYQVGQCKFPQRDWLEANYGKVRSFGAQALDDARDALRYLTGSSELKPNDKVRQLYALIEADRNTPDFRINFFIIVFGRLRQRAADAFKALQKEHASHEITITLIEVDGLVEEFVVGANHAKEPIRFDVRICKKQILRASGYCYLLANAADLYHAFMTFGWRLFDLNLRYEVKNSSINGEIVDSLSYSKSRKNFHHYNNGLIVIAKNYSIRDDRAVHLEDAQIVNGLQTVKSIYNAISNKAATLAEIEAACMVQVKIIQSAEADVVSKIVKATNNQNPMAARNLRSNNREQKTLRVGFDSLTPRWFFQVKEEEWTSLTSEGARFFEQVAGRRPHEYKPDAARKFARVIDNQEAAKAWLAFIGMSDYAGDRVTHFFAEDKIYEIAFKRAPSEEYWQTFAASTHWSSAREALLAESQGTASQYLLAYFLLKFVNSFIPPPQKYRQLALQEGVKAGTISKASGSYTSPARVQEDFLAENRTYQTWRLMANMKELLVELVSQVLARRYGPLTDSTCAALLQSFEASRFIESGDARQLGQAASLKAELAEQEVYGRVMRMLHYVSQQFWEDQKQALLSTSRLRTLLLKREVAAELKDLVWQTDKRSGMDRPWKSEGCTFLESLPMFEARSGKIG